MGREAMRRKLIYVAVILIGIVGFFIVRVYLQKPQSVTPAQVQAPSQPIKKLLITTGSLSYTLSDTSVQYATKCEPVGEPSLLVQVIKDNAVIYSCTVSTQTHSSSIPAVDSQGDIIAQPESYDETVETIQLFIPFPEGARISIN